MISRENCQHRGQKVMPTGIDTASKRFTHARTHKMLNYFNYVHDAGLSLTPLVI